MSDWKPGDVTWVSDATTIDVPKLSPWRCYLTPDYVIRPRVGAEPNRFHRFMQRLAFGFKWVKEEGK